MNNKLLNPGERIDDLIINDLKLIQHEREFRFSLDAVLLAHFANIRHGASVVDLGTGTGVIGILLTALGAGKVTGLEINPRMADSAQRSVKLNRLEGRMQVINADFRQLKGILPPGQWDVVVANPPYWPVGQGLINPKDTIAAARHEVTATLADVVEAARYLVKYRGRFAMIHIPERMVEILSAMSQAGLEPKRLRLVYPAVDKKPNLMLVEGIRGGRPGLDVLAPLIIYDQNGNYTPDIIAYYPQQRK
ncbi:MAG: tRNA1(Val) (adenine(37)-N6)-methyltransferase [Veillonellaceae bacterium]|jgi:tRNA1Val (adenine37-N6)-methyltransferase|nr:tRNA1(Val) (adenine(37)-N6)-methyltransferase [Veillonellaceae bacterium]